MDTDVFQTNLRTVKEQVLDECKLISYVSLSKELCIHVNDAKSLLCKAIQEIRKNNPEIDLCVCYIISGLLSNNSGCTTVCTEEDLDGLKKPFKVVFFEHVYSVSRGVKAVDSAALSALNKFEDLPLCTGLIKSSSCTKRTHDEIGNLISNNVSVESKQTKVESKSSKEKITNKLTNGQDSIKVGEVKPEPNIKSEVPSPKKDVPQNKTPVRNGNKTASKGIAGFFNKANSESTKVNNSKEKSVHNRKVPETDKNKTKLSGTQIKVEKEDIKVQPELTSNERGTSSEPSKPISKASTTKATKEKAANSSDSVTQIKKNAIVDKKRKRLLHVSDSESENEDNDPFSNENMDVDNQSEDEIPPTPTVNTVKVTSAMINPKKRRKIVDKTYTDEDGYILTKKEEVYESCSDNENEATDRHPGKENGKQVNGSEVKETSKPAKTNSEPKDIKTEISPKEKSNKKKKVSPPQKGKQSTINSFFKKV